MSIIIVGWTYIKSAAEFEAVDQRWFVLLDFIQEKVYGNLQRPEAIQCHYRIARNWIMPGACSLFSQYPRENAGHLCRCIDVISQISQTSVFRLGKTS